MKVLAKDLKAGQRARYDGGEVIGTGLIDNDGDVVLIDIDLVGRYSMDWAAPSEEVELIDPPAEPTYAELQAEWCNDHGVVVGSRVKVTRRAEEGEQGWSAVWMGAMDRCVGAVGLIEGIDEHNGLVVNDWCFPYFVLEPLKEPTYRPYTDAELLEQLGAKVRLKSKDRSHGRLITDVDLGTAVIGLERVSAEALRNKYEHLDGTACGVEE